LIVFTDRTRAEPELMLARFSELGRRAQPGSVLFTLRDYDLSARARLQLAERLARLARATGQQLGVADRADLARAFGCTGFHLPEAGISAADARQYLGSQVFLSRACHDVSRAVEAHLDARLVSPLFEARKGRLALGLAALGAAAGSGECASFALGGVGAANAAACLAAGARGVAVIGAALAPDPAELLRALGILRV
jgi:thiamine-phosphate pyrophosphorylase